MYAAPTLNSLLQPFLQEVFLQKMVSRQLI